MLDFLKLAWKKWMELGHVIGNFMSGVFLVIFYYTIFALFALPFKLFSKPLAGQSSSSNWVPKAKTIHKLEEFQYEH